MADRLPKWISIQRACEITGHPTSRAFDEWVRGWNRRNPDLLVQRRPNYTEQNSLLAALQRDAENHTPGAKLRKARVGKALSQGRRVA